MCIRDRVSARWGLDETSEEGRLAHRQIGRRLAEEVRRRRADPICAVTKIDRVEVALEDLLLCEAFFESQRKGGLCEFAIEGDLRGEHDVLEVLLSYTHLRAHETVLD